MRDQPELSETQRRAVASLERMSTATLRESLAGLGPAKAWLAQLIRIVLARRGAEVKS